MNLFSVLSMGKSTLHETSMSAMLAYLLNPNQDHGLGNKFLDEFLKLAFENGIYKNYVERSGLKFEIDLEVPYTDNVNKKRCDIDIQIKILNEEYNELHRIIIENKLKSESSDSSQLNRYFNAVIDDNTDSDAKIEKENISVIFLTPKINSKGLSDEFNNLKHDNKFWLYWKSEDEETTIVKLIQKILELEQKAEISPINEYMKHTLKAFMFFISNGSELDSEEIKKYKKINIDKKIYRILLRRSGQIQLLDEDGEKVTARPLLRKFLQENNSNVSVRGLNTRQLGIEIFKHLEGKYQ